MKHFLRQFTRLLLLGVLMGMLAIACDASQYSSITVSTGHQQNCRIVKYVRGEACIPLHPKRIVTLDFNSLASLLALDIKPIATWITTEIEADFPYFEGKADGVEVLHSASGQINLERLLLLRPDLIIVISHPWFEGIYQPLSKIAPTIILPWVETKGDWKHHLKETARVFEKNIMADHLMADYYHRVEKLKSLLGDRKAPGQEYRHSPIRVSFAYIASGQLVITRQNSFAGGVLNDVGLLNPLFQNSGDLDLPISEELLPEINSDVLFIAALRQEDTSVIERLQKKPLWSKLKAVQNDQVYLVDFSVWRGLNILAAHEVLNDLQHYLVNTPSLIAYGSTRRTHP